MHFRIVLSMVTATLLAENVRWGTAEAGWRLGVGKSGDAIVIVLRNTGSERRDLTLSYPGPAGPFYNVRFTALTPDGAEVPVFDVRALKAPITGYRPALEKTALPPGADTEMVFPLSQLIGVVNRRDVPLRALLGEGYAVRADFQAHGVKAASPLYTNKHE